MGENKQASSRQVIGEFGKRRRLVVFDELQWAIEEQRPNGEWKPKQFFHTKAGLAFAGVPPELLEGLPDTFPAF